ncbi:hypothetical protein HanIR_Chr17g0902151 [Helianthus annuus]|nr:hypothetical protein HanIR_Chr17g0902151 [Helianthus annuus]
MGFRWEIFFTPIRTIHHQSKQRFIKNPKNKKIPKPQLNILNNGVPSAGKTETFPDFLDL